MLSPFILIDALKVFLFFVFLFFEDVLRAPLCIPRAPLCSWLFTGADAPLGGPIDDEVAGAPPFGTQSGDPRSEARGSLNEVASHRSSVPDHVR